MKITVKYLASLAESLNKSTDDFYATQPTRVGDIWQALNPGVAIKANTLCALDFEYVTLDTAVEKDAELAFFPPVTGG